MTKLFMCNVFGVTKYSECCEILVLKLDILNDNCELILYASNEDCFCLDLVIIRSRSFIVSDVIICFCKSTKYFTYD